MAPKSTQKWSKKWSKKLPPKSWILRRFWAPIWDHFGVKWPLKIQQCKFAGTIRPAYGTQKPLKNVKLSSKSGFSPQELPNWSQNINMKWLKNVKLSSKSGFSHQELSNSSQDTNIKQLKNVKQWSKPAFTTQELQYNSLKTWIHRSNHLLALKSFQTYQKILT